MAETYSVAQYGRMIADRTRMEAYARALEAVVRPGSVVLDIGTGTGIFALLACRLGARRVYAVDPADAVAVAREAARANGFADRIEVIQDLSTRISLPEPADVVVSDVRGVLPTFQSIVATLADARARLMAPGGQLIPRADTLWAAPLGAPQAWGDLVFPWDEGAFGLDLSAARRAALNQWTRGRFSPDQLLAAPAAWATIDYRTAAAPDVRGSAAWTAYRGGTAHGFAVWFEAELAEGVAFHTGPGTDTIYQTAFFPWPEAVEVAAGDRIEADFQARLVGDEYVWIWESRVERRDRPSIDFRQSTFLANPPSPSRLRRRAHDFRPVLGEEGRIDAMILARMDGGATLGEIAREVRAAFPARFPTWEEALTRVGRLSEGYADGGGG